MSRIKTRKISMLTVTTLFLAIAIFLSGSIQEVQAAPKSKAKGNYAISVNGKKLKDSAVYVKNGRTYVSLRALSDSLNLKISLSESDGPDSGHKYELNKGNKRITIDGNDNSGYWIWIPPLNQGDEEGTTIYEPERICKPETDHCWIDEPNYRGPLTVKGTLYVPVREMAQALDMTISTQKVKGKTAIEMKSMKSAR